MAREGSGPYPPNSTNGGSGAFVTGSLTPTSDETLTIVVAGGGNVGKGTGMNSGAGGYGGGGSSPAGSTNNTGGGGGMSSLADSSGNLLLAAGGGGGGANSSGGSGGDGGAPNGSAGDKGVSGTEVRVMAGRQPPAAWVPTMGRMAKAEMAGRAIPQHPAPVAAAGFTAAAAAARVQAMALVPAGAEAAWFQAVVRRTRAPEPQLPTPATLIIRTAWPRADRKQAMAATDSLSLPGNVCGQDRKLTAYRRAIASASSLGHWCVDVPARSPFGTARLSVEN